MPLLILRLPAPAQRRVELNHGEQLVQTGLRQAQLRRVGNARGILSIDPEVGGSVASGLRNEESS